MIIRNRSASDGGALEAIALATHRLDRYPMYLPADLRSFIVNEDALGAWVAEDDSGVLGHVALHPSSAKEVMDLAVLASGVAADRIAVVARLLVAPEARRRGTGRALLEKATQEAARLGRRAVLDVVEDHTAAIRLYEDCGWTRAGQVDWALPGDLPLREFVYLAPIGPTPQFRSDLYQGTAHYYDRYRLPYPALLIDDLVTRAALSGTGRLLDLACGPGRVTFPLSEHFADVLAIDQEEESVSYAQALAAERGAASHPLADRPSRRPRSTPATLSW